MSELGYDPRQDGGIGQALNHYSLSPLGRSLAGRLGWKRNRRCSKCYPGGLYDFIERICSGSILKYR